MNYITLYDIGELNRVDTPVFDTEENQQLFFDGLTKKVIQNNSFYVPKFKDEICLSTDDINFNSSYTYLSIYFNEKYYYYFIDKTEYISEDVVKLYISIDVIQTYMFNIRFNSSEILRKSIKRWTSSTAINRGYFRENVGNEIFKNTVNELFYDEDGTYAFVIHIMPTNQKYWYSLGDNTNPILEEFTGYEKTMVAYGSKNYVESGYYLILPFNSTNLIGATYVSDTITDALTLSAWDLFRAMCERDYVLSINIIDGHLLSQLGITYDHNTNTFTCYDANHQSRFIQIYNGGIPGADPSHPSPECAGFMLMYGSGTQYLKFPEVTYSKTPLAVSRNTAKNKAFSYKYCPQLLDENYVHIKYGEPAYMTGTPLYVNTTTKVTLRECHDLINNIRVYAVSSTPSNDKYLTTVYATSIENITLYNNPYQSYISRNHATLSAGRVVSHINNIYTGVKAGISSGNVAIGVAAGAMGALNTEANRAITLENLKFTPNSTKVNGSGAFDIISLNIAPRYIVDTVSNLDECAQYFETFGYKVHEISRNNLFTTHIRYYYDYLEVGEMSISLNILSDDYTIELIKERFNKGLRMWHTTNGVLNTELVSGVTLNMGQVCVYDNVEN